MLQRIEHTIPPVFDADSRVLILGTFPSPKSREAGFYYGHPQNRFWPALAALFNEDVPVTEAEKEVFLRRRHIALWDVVASCEINGADDSSIRNPLPNKIAQVIAQTAIQGIFTTGKKAFSLYQKLCYPETGFQASYLPSPSPANCRLPFEQLLDAYRAILAVLEKEPLSEGAVKQE